MIFLHPFYDASRQLLTSGNSTWLGLFSMLLYLIFWAVICIIAYRWVRKHWTPHQPDSHQDRAVQIVRERFARGDISAEQFQEMLDILEKSARP